MRGQTLARLVLVASVLLAYGASPSASFQFDDFNVVVDNPVVHSWAAWWADLPRGLRPLLKASYVANWLSGLGAAGYRAVNVLIHAANALLVYELVLRLLRAQVRPAAVAGSALAAALLFALHPVQTEAVAYICGRSMSLMALFYLASLLAYAEGAARNRAWLVFGLSPLLFALALASKETALTLPCALGLWEACTAREGFDWKPALRRQAAHLALLAAFGVALAFHPRYASLLAFAVEIRSLEQNLLTQIDAVAYLFSRFLWIHRLNIDPDLPVHSEWTAALALEFVLLASLAAAGIACLRRQKWLAFGLLWTFLQLAPTNSFVPRLDVANERQLYLASLGVFLILAVGAGRLVDRLPALRLGARALALAAALALGGVTFLRTLDYRSEIALWQDTTQKSPGKARAWNNLGFAYHLAGQDEEARAAYGVALRLDPSYRLAANNLRQLP